VGGGSYHWHLTDARSDSLFVTVDDLDTKDWLGDDRNTVAHGLNAALATARWLRDNAELAFVAAPLTALDGQSAVRLGDRYAVSVSPCLDGCSHPFGPHADPVRRRHVLDALIALHSVAPPPDTPNHIRPRIGARAHLDAFLHIPKEPWNAGPLGEQARALLAPHTDELVARLDAFDRTSRSLASARGVITHGEPHGANVMTVRDREVLIDWDTVGIAVPERDLWFFAPDDADLQRYADATGHQPNTAGLALYRARWQFDDLSHVVKTLRGPHDANHDSERWLAALQPLIETMLAAPTPQL
jgi:spectinomycin phosphotransferase